MRQGILDSIVLCWLFFALFVFVSSEVLSLFSVFATGAIKVTWLLLVCTLILPILSRKAHTAQVLIDDFRKIRGWFPENFKTRNISFIAVVVLLGVTFIHALIAPSFDVDALGYHLPRATHWLVNRNVDFYETAILRQNFQAPLYSYSIAHLMALTGSDQFFNLIQWLAFLVNATALSLIARELNVSRCGQWCVAVLSFCIPQALSQTIVCVNDLYAATSVMVFVLFLIRFLRSSYINLGFATWAALAMGISFVSKYTSLIHVAGFAVPLSLIALVRIWRNFSLKKCFQSAAVLSCVVVVGCSFLIPQITRNITAYDDPFSGEPPGLMTNVNLTPAKFAVNYIRHLSMHAAFPLYAMNKPLENAVKKMSGDLVNDPDISFRNRLCFTDYRIFIPLGKYSSNASNPVQLALFLFLLFAIVGTRFKKASVVLEYSVIPVVFGSLIYCAVFKFQPWCSRLHLPYFMLMTVGVVMWFDRCSSKFNFMRWIMFLSLSYAVLHVFLFSDWYMPAFLYGDAPAESGLSRRASLVQKIRYLHSKGWPRDEIAEMKNSVPDVLQDGYSIFLTDRNRLYIGNQYHDDMSYLYNDTQDTLRFLQNRVADNAISSNIGLLISSDHGNLFPETASFANRPFSWEFLLWKMADNITGESEFRFCHFALSDPVELCESYFDCEDGLIVSDYSRESVLNEIRNKIEVDMVFSNRVFSVFQVNNSKEPVGL